MARASTGGFDRPRLVQDARHEVIYRRDDEFCAWPFLGGLWRPADGSLLLGFTRTPANYARPDDVHHDNLGQSKGILVTIRSPDGGRSWPAESIQPLHDLSTPLDVIAEADPFATDAAVDFCAPDVLVASGAVPVRFAPGARAWTRISTDGGRHWRSPVTMPMSGLQSLSGQGSAIFRSDGMCLVALTAVSDEGWTRRPLIYASPDGVSWNFLCFMTPRQDSSQAASERIGSWRFAAHRYFYPRLLRLRNDRLLATMRCQRDPRGVFWTEVFDSTDGGRTWSFLSRVNDWGAPGDIIELADGRILCVYGYRLPAFGIRYRLSEDGGRTWGSEWILRDDGGSWDLGYPRVVETEPGTCLAAYYFNLKSDPIQMNGGVRHIAQSIFRP